MAIVTLKPPFLSNGRCKVTDLVLDRLLRLMNPWIGQIMIEPRSSGVVYRYPCTPYPSPPLENMPLCIQKVYGVISHHSIDDNDVDTYTV